MDSVIEKNIRLVKEKIKRACVKARRREEEISLVAVTKNVPVRQIKTAIKAGITDVGENKAQEAFDKFSQLGEKVTWHFIGHLQRNKVKQIVSFADLIQSVDSLRLAEEINARAGRIGKVQNILVQVNIAEEDAKFGLRADEVRSFLVEISEFKNLRVKGLMTIAPFVIHAAEVHPLFVEMKSLFDEVEKAEIKGVEMKYLSMGMTNDFEIAIEAGANMVRIGTGIFGNLNLANAKEGTNG